MVSIRSSLRLAVAGVACFAAVADAAPAYSRTVRAQYRGGSLSVGVVSADVSVAGTAFGAVQLATNARERTVALSALDDATGTVAISVWQRSADGAVIDLGTFCSASPAIRLRRPGAPITVRPVVSETCGVTARPPVTGVISATFRR